MRNPLLGNVQEKDGWIARGKHEQINGNKTDKPALSLTVSENQTRTSTSAFSTISNIDCPTPIAEEKSGEKVVDVVISDMCEPWAQTEGFWRRSLSDPYHRMMNTSGMSFRDHAGSMVIEHTDR